MKKKLLVAACALLAMGAFGVGSKDAAAQCRYGGGGYGGGYYGGGFSGYSVPRSSFSIGIGYNSNRGFGSSAYYGSGYRGSFRSAGRGHYDYHPTSVYRHRNHYHVVPGHLHYHRGRHR